jgi:hypothetical protein
VSVVAAAFCPHPPLLVPAVGAGEPVALRGFAVAAVRWLTSQHLDRVIALGSAANARCHPPGAAGSFAGYGVDLAVRLPGPVRTEGSDLPLPLAVAAWLLAESGWTADVLGVSCDPSGALPAWDGAATAREGLLVMGDGSARRSEKAPGWLDDRAAPYDAAVSAALASGDPSRLAADLTLGHELLAAGAPAWTAAARLLAGGQWDAHLSYDDAPFGVGYFVATWSSR